MYDYTTASRLCKQLCHIAASCLYQGCARDLLGRDRDETRDADVRDRDETETLDILSETRPRRDPRRKAPRPRRDVLHPRRDRDRDVAAAETLTEMYGI